MNIASSGLTAAQRRFADEFAALLAPWGLAPASGRAYAYLLLKREAVSLDQIAADLGMSKAGAWNAAKALESFGHVRRYGQPGSKRALYAPTYNYANIFLAHGRMWGELGALLRDSASEVASDQTAGRLQEMGAFLLALRERVTALIEELKPAPTAERDPAQDGLR